MIRKVGQIGLGDRWNGRLEVRGDHLFVGRDEGRFRGSAWGGVLSPDPKDRVVRIDVAPPPPSDGSPGRDAAHSLDSPR